MIIRDKYTYHFLDNWKTLIMFLICCTHDMLNVALMTSQMLHSWHITLLGCMTANHKYGFCVSFFCLNSLTAGNVYMRRPRICMCVRATHICVAQKIKKIKKCNFYKFIYFFFSCHRNNFIQFSTEKYLKLVLTFI